MLYLVFFGACWQTFRRFYVGDDFPPHFYRMAAGQRLLVLARKDRKESAKLANFAKFCKILQIFSGLVLGCIKTKFCKKICV